MKDLKYYQKIIQDKRKQTDFRVFLMEIVSWHPFILNKNKDLISRFPKSDRVQICSKEKFVENRDSLTKHGRKYDFSQDFFQNFSSLFQSTPLPNMFHYRENENSDFTDTAVDSKNTYLSNSVVLYSQNVLYSFMVRWECDTILNSVYVSSNSENIYFSRWVLQSYKVFYSAFINNSNNVWFCSNVTGCSECILCENIENMSYCISNKQYSKEQYLIEKQKILAQKDNFPKFYSQLAQHGVNHNSTNVSWNYVIDSENVVEGHYVSNTKDASNVMFVGAKAWNKDLADVFIVGGSWRSDNYWVQSTGWSDAIYCSACIGYSNTIFYSYFLEWCSYCIWCVWLQNKSYCILNTQYSKEDWEILADKIFAQMEQDNELGNFFPADMNPFYFNDTMAEMLGDFSRDEVEAKWYMWRDEEIKIDIPEWSEVIYANPDMVGNEYFHSKNTGDHNFLNKTRNENIRSLQDFQWYDENNNWKIDPEILNKVIVDEKWDYYRIVQMEYDFLVKHGLPVPEMHWMDRIKLNFWINN